AMSLSESFTRGDPGAELPNVMLAMQKADLSFRAMNEVRNRLVEAYRDVMNLQM
ncbi:MAG: flagellar hook-basal body complex protein FliE, partial [Lysobacterales bacterium CG_4_10_14_3_um_filter_64_11]